MSRLQYQCWTPDCALEVVLQKDHSSQSLKLLEHWSERLFSLVPVMEKGGSCRSKCKNNSFLVGHMDVYTILTDKALLTKTKSHRSRFLPSPNTNQNRQKAVWRILTVLWSVILNHVSAPFMPTSKLLLIFLLSPPSFPQSPWKHKIKCNSVIKYPYLLNQIKKKSFVWDLDFDELGPSRIFALMFSETSKDQACYQHH